MLSRQIWQFSFHAYFLFLVFFNKDPEDFYYSIVWGIDFSRGILPISYFTFFVTNFIIFCLIIWAILLCLSSHIAYFVFSGPTICFSSIWCKSVFLAVMFHILACLCQRITVEWQRLVTYWPIIGTMLILKGKWKWVWCRQTHHKGKAYCH